MSETTQQIEAILAKMRGGDANAADDLMSAVQSRLRRYSKRIIGRHPVRDFEETGDLQNTVNRRLLVELEDKTDSFDSAAAFLSYAWTIARRALVDMHRKHFGRLTDPEKSRVRIESPAQPDFDLLLTERESDLSAEELELSFFVSDSISQLPEPEQTAINLVYFEGMTRIEGAAAMQVKLRQLYHLLENARTLLSKSLEDSVWKKK